MRAIDLDVATLTMVNMRTKELIRTPGRNLPMILVPRFNDASVPAAPGACSL
jgi:hypothetical protein